MMETLKETIMRRDHLTSDEADDQINAARKGMNAYLMRGEEEAAYDVCNEYFGLEPDYIYDLI